MNEFIFTFKRESGKFDDILKDINIRKHIATKILWKDHLMIGLSSKADDSTCGYIILKYGEDIVNPIEKDYSPIPNVDYIQVRS